MKILVTGSLGTIGSRLTKELERRDYGPVYGCDLVHGEDEYGNHFGGAGQYQRCDVGSFRQVQAMLKRLNPNLVYHAAAEFGRWNGEDFYEQLWQTNVIGTKNIIRMQEELGFRLVHFSSSEVYSLLNDYALTKWVNEKQIRNSEMSHGTESVIVRLFNTYGPGERYSPYRSVNCRFLYRALQGWDLFVHRGHMRTSTYVDDTVRTLANIAEKFVAGLSCDIGGNKQHSIEELANAAVLAMKSMSQITFKDSEPMTVLNKMPDNVKAVELLGHECTVSLEEGMKRTAEWMRKVYVQ